MRKNPEAGFVILQPGEEKGHVCGPQIFGHFIELAKTTAPANPTDKIYSIINSRLFLVARTIHRMLLMGNRGTSNRAP